MKNLTSILLASLLTGCAASPVERATNHDGLGETLHCQRPDAAQFTKFGDYRLVFMTRDFTSSILVWMDPDTAKVVVLKKTPTKVCVVHNSIPRFVFTPYGKKATEINKVVEEADDIGFD